jgi:hypothetical protein
MFRFKLDINSPIEKSIQIKNILYLNEIKENKTIKIYEFMSSFITKSNHYLLCTDYLFKFFKFLIIMLFFFQIEYIIVIDCEFKIKQKKMSTNMTKKYFQKNSKFQDYLYIYKYEYLNIITIFLFYLFLKT